MAWGDREFRGPEERRASKLPVPPGLSRGTLKLTVPDDESLLPSCLDSSHPP
jgi:hypothetical protein